MKKEFDLMLCDDGVTRSVPIIDGVKVDPSKGKPKEIKKEEKPENQKFQFKIELVIKFMILFQVLNE